MKEHHGWGDQVTIVSSDMRSWNAPEKADILISELLGSFGDNELSPECLDGAQNFLKGKGSFNCWNFLSIIVAILLLNRFYVSMRVVTKSFSIFLGCRGWN